MKKLFILYSCGMFFSGAKYEQDFLMGDLNKQTFKKNDFDKKSF